MTTDLITRARDGDGDAFQALTEPHRRELQVHCYRMLGSLQDAEDVLQDTLLAAWQGLGGFERRSSIRTWLYRIATNRCLNALRASSRRPAREWNNPDVEPPAGASDGGEEAGSSVAAVILEGDRRHGDADVGGEQGDQRVDVARVVGADEPGHELLLGG